MANKYKVRIPIDTSPCNILIPEPCTYCRESKNNKYLRINIKYPIQQWGKGYFDTWELQNTNNENGTVRTGTLTIEAAYCLKHLNAPDIIKETRKWAFNISISIAIIVFIALMISITSLGWSEILRGDKFLEYLLIIIAIPSLLFYLVKTFFYYGGQWTIKLIKPEYRDYSFETSGHWGLDFLIITDAGEKGIGPITYSCEISFANPESAELFKKTIQ
jgi:hypothetical protein